MKKIICIASILLLVYGCKSYYQIFEIESIKMIVNENNDFVFENDSVKITYNFWAECGLLSFSIYNKLDKPLYIDWKKSSYIENSNKRDYWVDEEQANSASFYGNYFYYGAYKSYGVSSSSTTKVKIERITFIPPKSKYNRCQFYLLPISYYKLDKDLSFDEVQRQDKPKKNTKVYRINFTKESSPLVFRNFLAFSLTENFKDEFYIDNEFYIETIKEINEKHINVKSEKKGTAFFIFIPSNLGYSIEERKKAF